MTPLNCFQKIVRILLKKPFHFWLFSDKENLQKETGLAIQKLKKDIEAKSLTSTIAYKILTLLEKDVANLETNEVIFIQHLANLLELYRLAPVDKKTAKLLDQLNSEINQAKGKILEYHLSLEKLQTKTKGLSEEEKNKKDLETLQKVGIFYVLEYTLQVLYEFKQLSDKDKVKLLKEGLKTKVGNLPAFLPLEASFRKDLGYQIFNIELRNKILEAFYQFEECLDDTQNLKELFLALKKLNIALLKIFKSSGLAVFKAVIYTPFGNNLPMEEIIKQVEKWK